MSASRQVAVTLDNVTLGYGGRLAVEALTGEIESGALLALVGPNGAGKSTLLKALAGLHTPARGQIRRAEQIHGRVAYMAQHTEIDRSFPLGLLQFVAMGLWHEIGWWRPLGKDKAERARATLAQVGLAGLENRRIGELSGGQLRRALFARTMLQDAALVLLDEPFAGVDAAITEDLLAIIRGWHQDGRTIVVAVHDLHQVRAHFPSALLLARRAVAWGKPDKILTNENLAAARALCAGPYTAAAVA